jgi:hypothetical protein
MASRSDRSGLEVIWRLGTVSQTATPYASYNGPLSTILGFNPHCGLEVWWATRRFCTPYLAFIEFDQWCMALRLYTLRELLPTLLGYINFF